MSWEATAYVKKLTHGPTGQPITRSEKLLLLVLSDYYNIEDDMAWPSVPELAKHALLSERQTQRLLHSLIVKQVLTAIPRKRPDGGDRSTGYRFPALTSPPQGGDTMSPGGVTPCHQGGDIRCHRGGDTIVSPAFLNLYSNSLSEPDNYQTSSDNFVPNGKNPVPHSPTETDSSASAGKPKKPKRAIKPLAENDWLFVELMFYHAEIDIAALNDEEWWATVANSFPDFSPRWINPALASLARWLMDNPTRRPHTPRGWKQRMNFSLNWFYDKHMRRQPHG